MRAAGIDNDVHIYDSVEHGFWLHTERDPGNNRPAAAHAWERLRAYLNRTIDGPDPAQSQSAHDHD
jgi:dienelactone hydrolase